MTTTPTPAPSADALIERLQKDADYLGPDHAMPDIAANIREAITAIRSLATPPSAQPSALLTDDMRELIVAARIVAYEDQSHEAIKTLDRAVDKFAEAVAWDNEPDNLAEPEASAQPSAGGGERNPRGNRASD